LAGVAAGLSKYFGIDVILIRILFVIGVFTGGWGILLYVALWLLVPEATTSSERLQMVGKPVTVDSLKEVVARADVTSAAKRVNNSLAGPINSTFRVLLKIVGLGFIVFGLGMLFALIAVESYVLLHNGALFGQNILPIFPIGLKEHLLLNLSVVLAALLSVLVIIFGISIFKQKWPIKTWVTGTLIGLTLIGLAGTIALAADVAPQVRDRYNTQFHTTTRFVQPFTAVKAFGEGVTIRYQVASKYFINLNYFDNPNLSNIKTTVSNSTLLIDSSQFNQHRNCSNWCIPDTYDMVITISSPNPVNILYQDQMKDMLPEVPPIPPLPQ
jgi:phage shock protein PspC (stress-responsive transcriptional regulator)